MSSADQQPVDGTLQVLDTATCHATACQHYPLRTLHTVSQQCTQYYVNLSRVNSSQERDRAYSRSIGAGLGVGRCGFG